MPVVNPGIRRYIGSAIQRLFNSASFSAPLTHSLTLERGTGSPTFTRATTKTWRNNDGYMVTGVAGEIDFPGSRRVRNLFSYTENLNNAYWNKSTVTVASATAVVAGITCQKIEETAVIGAHYVYNSAATFAGTKGVISAHVAKGERDICWLYLVSGTDAVAYFNLTTGTVGTVTGTASPVAEIEEVDGGYRISLKATVAPGTVNGGVGSTTTDGNYNVQGTLGYGIYVGGLQLEDVTAQTNQVMGDYVPVGVPSAWWGPEHISNGDFSNGTTGWTAINSGSLSVSGGELQVTQAGATNGTAEQAITTIAGVKYVATVMARTSNASYPVYIVAGASSGSFALGAALTSSTTATLLKLEFTATGTTTYIGLRNTAVGGLIGTFDVVSVKPAVYLGSMADGVKCFPTDINGNPLTTMERFKPEPAATNLCLQSNAFTTTWTTSGAVTSAQNAIGPSGAANEAWTLGDTDAANLSDFRQEFVIANDSVLRGMQIRVGKTVGATTFPGVGIIFIGGTAVAAQWTVNTNLGTITARSSNVGTVAATIESAGNFWLIKMSATNNSTGNVTARIQMFPAVNADASATWVASTVGTAVFAYAGFEVGWPTSYIPTTTTAVARNADVLTYTGGDIANIKTLAAVDFRTNGVAATGTNYTILSLQDSSVVSNSILLRVNGTSLKPESLAFSGGVLQSAETHTSAVDSNAHSIAYSVAANNFVSAVDGGDVKTDASGAIPTGLTTLYVGHYPSDQWMRGHPGAIYGWTRNLGSSELQAITR